MKQTAVDWLENEFKEAHKMFGGIDTNWIKRFKQAKEMEKEQEERAYKRGQKYKKPLKDSNPINKYLKSE